MSVADNIAARQVRERAIAEAREIVELYKDYPPEFWVVLGALCYDKAPPPPPESKAPAKPKPTKPQTPEVDDFLEQIDEVLERIDNMPDRAAEFGESVGATVRGIAETVEHTGVVTDAQARAVNNIAAGVGRWFKDE